MKIWKKMLLKEVLKGFFFILLCFYLLYALIDYSVHMRHFQGAPLHQCLLYYFYQFIKRLELLAPVAFLLSLIKSLERMNKNNELLALQVAGLSFRTLITPLFALSCLLSTLLYFNEEWALPKAMNFADTFQKTYIKKKKSETNINVIFLKGGGRLIYQNYDKEKKTYHDLFYLPSQETIYRINSLQGHTGYLVDHLKKNKEGFYELINHEPLHHFQELHIPSKNPHYIPLENFSLSALYHLSKTSPSLELTSKLYYKLITPLFALFIVLLLCPYSFSFERGRTSFYLYAAGLFAFLFCFIFVNLAKVLGISGTLSPSLSFPFLILGLILLSFKKNLKYV